MRGPFIASQVLSVALCLRPVLLRLTVSPVRILLVEDHLMFREVLRKVCAEELRHEIVGEADDGRRAIELVAQVLPDLVLLDLHLPTLDGFAVLERLRKVSPHTRVLVLSSHCDNYTVFRIERARVQGFVDKNTNTVSALKSAIATVEAGKVWYSETFLRVKRARLHDPNSFDKLLTPRERDVLVLVGAALSDAKIAERLNIAAETVEKHRFNVLKKLGVESTGDLVRYAREHGFTLSEEVERGGSLRP